jgi:hypothetical protein
VAGMPARCMNRVSRLVGPLAPVLPEPILTVARTVADVLDDHVVFEVECIDRMYLNVYVPQLQHAGGLLGFIQRRLGLPVASTAPLATITDRFVRDMHRFAETQAIPWVDFARGQRKDDLMRERLATFTAEEGACSSAGRRRRSSCSGPRSAATSRASPTRGSCRRPG